MYKAEQDQIREKKKGDEDASTTTRDTWDMTDGTANLKGRDGTIE